MAIPIAYVVSDPEASFPTPDPRDFRAQSKGGQYDIRNGTIYESPASYTRHDGTVIDTFVEVQEIDRSEGGTHFQIRVPRQKGLDSFGLATYALDNARRNLLGDGIGLHQVSVGYAGNTDSGAMTDGYTLEPVRFIDISDMYGDKGPSYENGRFVKIGNFPQQ
jgi:hypothetical protein